MNSKNQISHDGRISRIESDIIYIRIIASAGCVSCQASSSCSVSEMEEKIVEVPNLGDQTYTIGESVQVVLKQGQGFSAVFLGYIMPFFVLLFTLIIMLSFTDNEGIAGLTALAMLIPYYFALYLLRSVIKRSFSFRLK